MGLVLDRTAADTLIEQAVGHAELGRGLFLHAMRHVPEERLSWSPSERARCPLQIAAHVALSNSAFASFLRGEQPPFRSFDDMMLRLDEAGRNLKTRPEVMTRFASGYREVRAALENLSPAAVAGMMDTGLMTPMPMTYFMFLPGTHMAEHASQLDYLQTIWGDRALHFLG